MIDPKKCCGCGVCAAGCPSKAISIQLSDEGFWLPIINRDKCTECNICEKICTLRNAPPKSEETATKYAAVQHKDPAILQASASGGAGWAIAQLLIKDGWLLVGVRYDAEQGIARHFIAKNLDEFHAAMNSKYIPSFTSDAFSQLWDGKRYVVFGTPCQLASLRRAIQMKKKEDHFFLVDFFCHGVPSYLLWNSYLQHMLRPQETLNDACFRSKKYGWHSYTMCLTTNQRVIFSRMEKHDCFLNLFLSNLALDAPCYDCRLRQNTSAADIRIGDFWGYKYSSDNDGVSEVIALTQRGYDILERLSEYCKVTKENRDVAFDAQITHNLSIPRNRKNVLNALKSGTAPYKLYMRYGWRLFLKNLIPYSIKIKLKQLIKKVSL